MSSGVTEESFILFNVPNCTGEENNIIECLATTVPDLTSGSCDYSGLSCTGTTMQVNGWILIVLYAIPYLCLQL